MGLMLVDVQDLPPLGPSLPSLDDWAVENGWDGFSESEVLQAFTEAHKDVSPKAIQRSRLIDKQLATLRWLEPTLVQQPQLGDACRVWFTTTTASHLAAANLLTLAQLLEQINGIGRQWWRSVPAIGQAKALRLQEWLLEHEATLGARIGLHVAIARSKLFSNELSATVPRATAIRPLEKFVVPVDLNGREGGYRQPRHQCLMSADNDYDAILVWLKTKQSLSPEAVREMRARQRREDRVIDPTGMDPLAWLHTPSHTQRAYRKEAERFLLWSILERGKALSSMSTEDCTAYRDFLADPQPAEVWCGPGSRERWSPRWRPFKKALSKAAQRCDRSQEPLRVPG